MERAARSHARCRIRRTRCCRHSSWFDDGGQGSSLRNPRIGVVRGGDHGNVDGRGELGPRQHVPPRRRRGPAQHVARRNCARWSRNRPLRDSCAGIDRSVRRRTAGRSHARISRQEVGSTRDHPCGAVDSGHARAGLDRYRHHRHPRFDHRLSRQWGDPGTPGSIHGFSEVLYAFASASNNNGSASAV